MNYKGILYYALVGCLVVAFAIAGVPAGANDVVTVTVGVNPAAVTVGDSVNVTINVDHVEDFDAAQYDIVYDPFVLQVANIADGEIDSKIVPVARSGFIPPLTPGTLRVINNIAGVSGVTGGGCLAVITFKAIGSASSGIIGLSNGIIGDKDANEIDADWHGGSVKVEPGETPPEGGGSSGGIYEGGGGGGSSATDDKRFTNISGSSDSSGVLWEEIIALSVDIHLELVIPKNTTVLNANGYPPYSITVATLAEPGDAPENSALIGGVYDITPNGLSFDPYALLNLYYDEETLPEGVNEENLCIFRFNTTTQTWEALECTVDSVNNCIIAKIVHLCRFSIITGTKPAEFSLGSMNVSASDIKPGDSVTVSATVTNTGDLAGTYETALVVNGEERQKRNVTLAGGEIGTIDFTLTAGEAGIYSIAIGNRQVTFVVKEPQTETISTPTLTTTEPSLKPEPEVTPTTPLTEQISTPEPEPTGTVAEVPIEDESRFPWWHILLIALGVIAAAFSVWKALHSQ